MIFPIYGLNSISYSYVTLLIDGENTVHKKMTPKILRRLHQQEKYFYTSRRGNIHDAKKCSDENRNVKNTQNLFE